MPEKQLPRLSPKQERAVREFLTNGGDRLAAYRKAYPAALGWKDEVVAARADRLFSAPRVQENLKARATKPKPKAKAKAKTKAKPKRLAKKAEAKPKRRGRPSKYTPALLALAKTYPKRYAEYGDVLPTVAGLAVLLGISRERVYRWAADPEKEAFRDILEELQAVQERQAWNHGLKKEFDSPLTKLILSLHGYSDRSTTVHEGGDKPIQTQEIPPDMKPEEAAKIYREFLAGDG